LLGIDTDEKNPHLIGILAHGLMCLAKTHECDRADIGATCEVKENQRDPDVTGDFWSKFDVSLRRPLMLHRFPRHEDEPSCLGRRRAVAQRAVRSYSVVVLSPLLDQYLCFA